jgi:hypothetical protein
MNSSKKGKSSRLVRRLLIFVWAAILLGATGAKADPVKTLVQDTLYRADGSVAHGTVTVRWNGFSTSAGEAVAAGVMTVSTDAKGGIAIPLIPNTGSTPSGSYYKVVVKLDDGTTSEEQWVVPTTASTTVAAIRAKVVPQAVAVQFVGRDYVDSALSKLSATTLVHLTGAETIDGTKTFVDSPEVPVPADAGGAANKGYVDQRLSGLATVASTGNYSDLTNKPANAAAQVNADWNSTSGPSQIFNKPVLAAVATSGSYNDLSNTPAIPNLAEPGAIGATTPSAVNATTVTAKNVNGLLSVAGFGAVNDGATDNTVAFQAAINASHATGACVSVPPGMYVLSAPVQLSGGECISGFNGPELSGGTKGTVLLPVTAAFVTANPMVDMLNVTIRDFYIRGGTTAIDLGRFFLVNLYDIVCQDQSGWCFSHVRGERHEIRNITCWHHTVAGQGCISTADYTKSIFAATYAAAGWTDQWWDRSIIDHVFDIGDSYTISDQYTIWNGQPATGGSWSNTNARWIMAHQAGQTALFRGYNVQESEFHDIGTDTVGQSGNPVPIVFDVEGFFQYSSLDGFYPSFSGNSYFTTGAYFKGLFNGSTVKNCQVGGNNTSTFGLRFGQNNGDSGQIIACTGAYYNDSASALWRSNIAITGSVMNPTNAAGAINFEDVTNSGAAVTLMADNNGASAATSSFKIIHATGSGGSAQTFSVQPTGASFDSGVASFANSGVLK